MEIELRLLILLVLANGAPIVARHLLGDCCAWPVDGGMRTPGGQPILGPSKTLRGLLAAMLLTTAVAPDVTPVIVSPTEISLVTRSRA